MAVKGEVKQSDKIAIATLKGYLSDGLTLSEMGDIEGVSKQAMSGRLKKYGLSTSRKIKKKVKEESQVKSSEVKSISLKPPKKIDKRKKPKIIKSPPLVLLDGDGGDDDPDQGGNTTDEEYSNVSPQFREIVNHTAFALKKIPKAGLGDVVKIWKETKMFENEEKDFAEDNAFLGEVEAMLFHYDIIRIQSDDVDGRVDNPDLIEEGI